jgi:hypothetical protein
VLIPKVLGTSYQHASSPRILGELRLAATPSQKRRGWLVERRQHVHAVGAEGQWDDEGRRVGR